MQAKRLRKVARGGAVALTVAAAATLAFGVSARSRPGALAEADLARLAPVVAADLSEAGLQRMASAMGAAAAALASRHDPAAGARTWGRFPGWESYDLRTAPTLGLGDIAGDDAKRLNAALPLDAAVGAAKPFVLRARTAAERDRAVRCLATAIYYEAALEPEQGQRAVAQVILNRVSHPEFPKSVCGVVYQGWERMTGCQFSFTCDGSLLRAPVPALYRRAEQYARDALAGHVAAEVGTSTFYHADYVFPYWAPTLSKVNTIGRHIFYRWPGAVGRPPAFNGRYRGGELAFSEAVLTGRAPRPGLPPAEALEALGVEVETVQASEAGTDGDSTRVRTVIAGRRQATAEDIARINALLAGSGPAAPAVAPAGGAQTSAAPAASLAEDLPMHRQAMPVTEVNKPSA